MHRSEAIVWLIAGIVLAFLNVASPTEAHNGGLRGGLTALQRSWLRLPTGNQMVGGFLVNVDMDDYYTVLDVSKTEEPARAMTFTQPLPQGISVEVYGVDRQVQVTSLVKLFVTPRPGTIPTQAEKLYFRDEVAEHGGAGGYFVVAKVSASGRDYYLVPGKCRMLTTTIQSKERSNTLAFLTFTTDFQTPRSLFPVGGAAPSTSTSLPSPVPAPGATPTGILYPITLGFFEFNPPNSNPTETPHTTPPPPPPPPQRDPNRRRMEYEFLDSTPITVPGNGEYAGKMTVRNKKTGKSASGSIGLGWQPGGLASLMIQLCGQVGIATEPLPAFSSTVVLPDGQDFLDAQGLNIIAIGWGVHINARTMP